MRTGTLRSMRSLHSPAYKTFFKRLVAARAKSGLTQGDVARRLGIPQSRLSRMESGERRIDVIELDEIALVYGRTITYFLPRSPTRSGAAER